MIGIESKTKLDELHNMTRQKPAIGLPAYFYVLPLLHLLIALPLAYYLNIWSDEASTLYTTENGFFQAVQNVVYDEKQAPLYFLILSVWREINGSIFFARIFSIICSLFAIAVFFKLARKFWGEKIAVIAAFFFALHPYLFWASLEIRVYSLVILLSCLLIKFFFDGYFERRKTDPEYKTKRKRSRIFFIAAAIIALYTNYYLGFLLVACFVVLLVFRRGKAARVYFFHMLAVLAAIIPLLWMIKAQYAVSGAEAASQTNAVEGLKLLWNHFLTFVLPAEINAPEDQTLMSFIRVWLVRILGILFVVLLVIKRKLLEGRVLIFGTICAVIFAFLYFAYFFMSEIYVQIRHAAVLFPPLSLLVIAVLTCCLLDGEKPVNKGKRFYITAAALILLTIFYSYGLFALYPNLTKRGDWFRVSRYIEENGSARRPVVIFPAYDALNLPYYNKSKNPILPSSGYFRWIGDEEGDRENMWIEEIEFVLSNVPQESEEIWFITNDSCLKAKACIPLEKFVKENYNIVKTKDFYKARVRLLRKK